MIVADAVLDQIVDQVYGHTKAVIEKQKLLNLCRRECLTEILFGDIKKLDDVLVLFEFAYTLRSKRFRAGRRRICRCLRPKAGSAVPLISAAAVSEDVAGGGEQGNPA